MPRLATSGSGTIRLLTSVGPLTQTNLTANFNHFSNALPTDITIGTTFRFLTLGTVDSGVAPGTLALTVRLPAATAILTFPTLTLQASQTGRRFRIEGRLTVLSVGAGGTATVAAELIEHVTNASAGVEVRDVQMSAAPFAFDTTASPTLIVRGVMSAAVNTQTSDARFLWRE